VVTLSVWLAKDLFPPAKYLRAFPLVHSHSVWLNSPLPNLLMTPLTQRWGALFSTYNKTMFASGQFFFASLGSTTWSLIVFFGSGVTSMIAVSNSAYSESIGKGVWWVGKASSDWCPLVLLTAVPLIPLFALAKISCVSELLPPMLLCKVSSGF
jgi:magnesium-transporting ATPase (P-type)